MRLEKEQRSGNGRDEMDQRYTPKKNKHQELVEDKVDERRGGVE